MSYPKIISEILPRKYSNLSLVQLEDVWYQVFIKYRREHGPYRKLTLASLRNWLDIVWQLGDKVLLIQADGYFDQYQGLRNREILQLFRLIHKDLEKIERRNDNSKNGIEHLLGKINANKDRIAELSAIPMDPADEAGRRLLLNIKALKDINKGLLHQVGMIYFKDLKDPEKAFACFNEIQKDFPRDIPNLDVLGRWYLGEKMYDRALDCYKKIISLEEKDTRAYFGLGWTYLSMDLSAEAIIYFNKVLSLGQELQDKYAEFLGYYGRAVALKRTGDYAGAIIDYEKARMLYDNDFLAWLGLGQVYYKTQDYQQAKTCFEKALELSRDDKEALRGLEQVYEALGQPKVLVRITIPYKNE